MQLSQPYFLLLALLLIPYIVWYIMRNQNSSPSLRVSTTEMVRLASGGFRQHLVHLPFLLRMLTYDCCCALPSADLKLVERQAYRGHRYHALYGYIHLNAG